MWVTKSIYFPCTRSLAQVLMTTRLPIYMRYHGFALSYFFNNIHGLRNKVNIPQVLPFVLYPYGSLVIPMRKIFSSSLNQSKAPYLHDIACFVLSSFFNNIHRLWIKVNIPQVVSFVPYLDGILVILVLAINKIAPWRARTSDLMVNSHTL